MGGAEQERASFPPADGVVPDATCYLLRLLPRLTLWMDDFELRWGRRGRKSPSEGWEAAHQGEGREEGQAGGDGSGDRDREEEQWARKAFF